MFAMKPLLSNFFVFPSIPKSIVYGSRTGRGLLCVTQPCIAAAGGVCGFFLGSVSITHWLFVRWKNGGRLTARLFSLSLIVSSAYCLLQWGKLIMSSTPCFTPPPLLFRSSHLEIIMSLWQTTLAWEKGKGEKKKITESICLYSNRPLAITDNLLTLESCRLKFFQGLTKTYV